MLPPAAYNLPPEILYTIFLGTIATSIHSVGLGQGTEWDIRVFTTLADVSPLFNDIAHKLAMDTFGLIERGNGHSVVHDAENLMHELSQLTRDTSGGWDAIATKYPDKYPSNLFGAYSRLKSAISLRRSSVTGPLNSFIMAQGLALDSLENLSSFRIGGAELAASLKLRCRWEKKLVTAGITLVRNCVQITSLVTTLVPPNLAQSQWQAISTEQYAAYKNLERFLSAIETAATNYEYACLHVGETQNAKAVQLPGVTEALKEVFRFFHSPNCTALAVPIMSRLSRWENIRPFFIDFEIPVVPLAQ